MEGPGWIYKFGSHQLIETVFKGRKLDKNNLGMKEQRLKF